MLFGIDKDGKASSGEDRWQWFTYKTDTGECAFEIYVPDTDEHLRMVTRFRMSDRKADWHGLRLFISRNWIRAWKGVQRMQGGERVDVPCTPDTRGELLKSDKVLFDWIHEKLKEGSEEFALEKADGGTA